jgi:hypothetical protein
VYDDIVIENDAPGMQFEGLEPEAVYAEDREVEGVMYRTQNAQYSASSAQWSLQLPMQGAYAVSQNLDGSIGFLQKPAESSPFTEWNGNGQHGVFNVRDYGATGNGTTDDTASIQAAVNAAGVLGGVVYVPPGTYLISAAILLGSKTTLQGAGTASILYAADYINGYPVSETNNVAMVASSNYLDGGSDWLNDIYVKDIQLYGNGPGNRPSGSNPQNGLISLYRVFNQGVYRCSIQSSSNHGIDILGNDLYQTPPRGNFWIVDCVIDLFPGQQRPLGDDVSGFPIRGQGLTQGYCIGNFVGFGNVYDGVGQRTNDAMDFVGCSSMIVTNNLITNCTDGIGTDDAKDVIIADNVIINAYAFGIASFAGSSSHGSHRMVIARNVIQTPGRPAIWCVPPVSVDSVYVDAVVCDNTIVFSVDGQPAILLEGQYIVCHHNSIDLADSRAIGIQCIADDLIVDSNRVFNGGSSGTGSTGIRLGSTDVFALTDVIITNNNVAKTTTSIDESNINPGGLTYCSIRGNVGIGSNPPASDDFSAPVIVVNAPVNNVTPYDCVVYLSGSASCEVSVSNAAGNLFATGLGTGVAFLVPAGASIQITTGAPASSFAWIWIPE